MKILVVEDEPYVAELIQSALEQLGNNCVVAENADDADELLDETAVDAVTLDLGMPGRGGLEWLEDVASDRPDLARKTLVITGMNLEASLIERLAACGAGLLAKPFTVQGLHDAVRTQLEWSGKHRRGQD
ncbi:MAG: response regulator [bacterium]|nr:response regulator [bacterium]